MNRLFQTTSFLLFASATLALAQEEVLGPERESRDRNLENRWVGEWLPAAASGVRISADFVLHFGEDYHVEELQGLGVRLHHQGEEDYIGGEENIHGRLYDFLLFGTKNEKEVFNLVIYRRGPEGNGMSDRKYLAVHSFRKKR